MRLGPLHRPRRTRTGFRKESHHFALTRGMRSRLKCRGVASCRPLQKLLGKSLFWGKFRETLHDPAWLRSGHPCKSRFRTRPKNLATRDLHALSPHFRDSAIISQIQPQFCIWLDSTSAQLGGTMFVPGLCRRIDSRSDVSAGNRACRTPTE